MIAGIRKSSIPLVRFLNIVIKGASEIYELDNQMSEVAEAKNTENEYESVKETSRLKPQTKSKVPVESYDPLKMIVSNLMELALDPKTMALKKQVQKEIQENKRIQDKNDELL